MKIFTNIIIVRTSMVRGKGKLKYHGSCLRFIKTFDGKYDLIRLECTIGSVLTTE